MAPSSTPTLDQLKRAVQIHEQIERLQTELASILGGARRGPGRPATKAVAGAAKKSRKGKRVMSPEAREKIVAAQRRRWAKQKKAKG